MTGYTVHTGSTEKFSVGWDNIFGKGSSGKGAAKAKSGARDKRPAAGAKSKKSAKKKR